MIPEIPGELVSYDQSDYLRGLVQQLCKSRSKSFPGSQPVSFTKDSLKLLEKADFWVCEKSDGVRCLLLILWNGLNKEQETYLNEKIDRKNNYRRFYGLILPNYNDPSLSTLASNTILDGELVIDHNKETGTDSLRYLAFDLLVVDGSSLFEKSLQSRYGRLITWIFEPYKKYLATFKNPNPPPFEIRIKKMERSYSIETVFTQHIPNLKHGNDGLIFTCAESGYVNGTDKNIIKWKDPSENSIDFKIVLRFPSNNDEIDFTKKPICELHQWEGESTYSWFDNWEISDEEWNNYLDCEVDIHEKIGEFVWISDTQNWKLLRFRDDKNDGNHRSVIVKILNSIMDGVKSDELISWAPTIKAKWKEREKVRMPTQNLVQRPQKIAPNQHYTIKT